MATFDSTGLTIDTAPDIQENLEDAFKTSFGDNIRLDAQSVFGQLIQNLSLTLAEIQELVESVSNSFDPQSASGTALSKLVLLNGIQRSEGTYSSVVLSCTASGATTIPAGSLVEDATGNQFATDTDLVFAGAGTSTVSATCTELGPIEASAGTLTTIVNAVYRWTAVTNAADAIPGELEETDAELRLRRQTVAERASNTSISALHAAISDVDGVEEVKVVCNSTTEVDSDGVPPQHIWPIVNGVSSANENAIAEAIFEHLGAGIGTTGSTTVSYYDTVTEANYDINFEEALPVTIYITVNINADDDYPADGDQQIEDAIIAHFENQKIGDSVKFTRLYTPINSVPGHEVTSLFIGLSASPSGTTNIDLVLPQIAVVTAASIVVNS